MTPAELQSDDASLIEALQRGDDDAYERVVRQYAGRMLAVARRMLKSEEDAQDALQEAFLSAFKAIDQFKGESRLSTWLHRIVVNACLMRIRRKRRRPEISTEDLLPKFHQDGHRENVGPAWRVDPSQDLIDEETRAVVYDAMARLPEEYRNVLLLRDIEGLNTREAAEVLDSTEGAVKVRLHRARLALRELIDADLRSDGVSS